MKYRFGLVGLVIWINVFVSITVGQPNPCDRELADLKALNLPQIRDGGDFNLIRSELVCQSDQDYLDREIVMIIGDSIDYPPAGLNQASLHILIRQNDEFVAGDRCRRVFVGRHGFTADKREGDGKTPLGVFQFGAFYTNLDYFPMLQRCQDSLKMWGARYGKYYTRSSDSICCYDGMVNEFGKVGDRLRYIPDGFRGNEYVDSSGLVIRYYRRENLAIRDYSRCAMINYNYGPNRCLDAGSAILFHLDDESHRTSGCVAIQSEDMERIYSRLYPGERILIAQSLEQADSLVNELPMTLRERSSLQRLIRLR